jgi:two-component system phosphate regulon sensor histidine kinase PhoR
MGIALIGVIAMQLYFLMQSYNMQSKLFDSSVNEALNNVVAKLSRRDAINFLNNKIQPNTILAPANNTRQIIEISDKNGSSVKPFTNNDSIKKQSHRQRKLALLRDSLKHMLMRQKLDEIESNIQVRIETYTDEFGVTNGRLIPIIKPLNTHPAKKHQKLEKYITQHIKYTDPQFGDQLITETFLNPLWIQEQTRIQKQNQLTRIRQILTEDLTLCRMYLKSTKDQASR